MNTATLHASQLQKLHDLLYLVHRTQGDPREKAIADARVELYMLREQLTLEKALEVFPSVHPAIAQCVVDLEAEEDGGWTPAAHTALQKLKTLLRMHGAQPQAEASVAPNWFPFLSDMADGCKGHFAIARINPTKTYREYIGPRGDWVGYGAEVFSRERAESKMRDLLASQPAPPALDADAVDAERWRIWAKEMAKASMAKASANGYETPFMYAMEKVIRKGQKGFTAQEFCQWVDRAIAFTRK